MPKSLLRFLGYWHYVAIPLLLLWMLSWIYTPAYPHERDILPELSQEPKQTSVNAPEFDFEWEDEIYHVQPQYQYEIWGLIVSKNNYNSFIDPTNTGNQGRANDLCVVWGENATSPDTLKDIEFNSTNYTCYFQLPEGSTFNPEQLSNNHLITADAWIHNLIKDAEVGDQIYLKGYLANYGGYTDPPESEKYTIRETSVNRTDRGNGACETIYVVNYQRLERNNKVFLFLLNKSRYLIGTWTLIGLILFFWSILYPPKKESKAMKDHKKIIKRTKNPV